jgi:hypothetical protein
VSIPSKPVAQCWASVRLLWAKDEVRLQQGPDSGSGGHRREMGSDMGTGL